MTQTIDKPRFRCSGLDRVFRCHGSRVLCALPQAQPMKEDRDNEMSALGSWGHYKIARWAMLFMKAFAPEGGLKKPDAPRPQFTIFDKIAMRMCIRELVQMADADMAIEVEAELQAEFPRFFLTGHVDVLAIDAEAKRAKAADWKLGYRITDAADANNQVLGYIVLLFLCYETLEEVTFLLVQPRIPNGTTDKVTEVTVTRDKLPAMLAWLQRKISAVLDDPYLFETGRRQCRYCDAAWFCPASQAEENEMKQRFTPEEIAKVAKCEDPNALFDRIETLKRLAEVKELVEKRFKHLLHVAGNSMTLADGRCVRFENRVHRYTFTHRGRTLFNDIRNAIGEEAAISLFDASPSEVKSVLGSTLRGDDGKPLQKKSTRPNVKTVETEFDRMLGHRVEAQTIQVVKVEDAV